ncbi:MAG: MFS transporter [Firmicutes bacterium]|jgi:MFS family permease|nr:MFS transporter [Bacillota bacterium]
MFNIRNVLVGYLEGKTMQNNALYSIADGMAYSIMTGLTGAFMGVFALSLGASDQMLGFLAAWPALVGLIAQIPSAIITERTEKKLKPLLAWGFAHRINFLFFAMIPFIPLSSITKAWLFILLVTWMNFPAVVVNTMWTQMMGEIFPIRHRARVFGDRNFILGWVSLGSMILAGPLLDFLPYPINYSILFGLSFLGLMVSLYYLSKVEEIEVEVQIKDDKKQKPLDGMKEVFKDKKFLHFTAGSFLYYIGFNISAPMWTLLHVRILHLSNTQIALVAILNAATATIFFRFWGRVSEKLGNEQVYFIGLLIFLLQPWLHVYVNKNRLWLLYALAVANGVASSAFQLSQFNTLLSVAPNPQVRPSYMAFYNMLMQSTGFIFPMLGIAVYGFVGQQINPVLYLSSISRTMGLIYLAKVIGIKLPFAKKLK